MAAREDTKLTESRQRASELARRALELPEGQRDEFLKSECGGDGDFLRSVHLTLDAMIEGVLPRAERSAPTPPSFAIIERLAAHAPRTSRYELKGEVARGGMGAILKVWDEDLRRTLAMKVTLGKVEGGASTDTPSVDERTLGRFLEEAQVTGQLDHPGIVPVHDLGLDAEPARSTSRWRLVRKDRRFTEVIDLACRGAGTDGWTRTRALERGAQGL